MAQNKAKTEDKYITDLLGINVEIGWNCDFRCEDCYRFFRCPSKSKMKMYDTTRMQRIKENLGQIKNIIAVCGGKGGVGKSTISANIAVGLAQRGYATAILDSDFHGTSIPSILGVQGAKLRYGPKGIVGPSGPLGIKVIATSFLLQDNDVITWLSDLKTDTLELFLGNTDYGRLDYLVVDLPSGTGSETVNLLKYLPQIGGVIVVTIPSGVSEQVVRKCLSLCQQARVPILGLVENMSSYTCPVCHAIGALQHSAGDFLAREKQIPLLGKIPQDPLIVTASDQGKSFLIEYPDSPSALNFRSIVDKVEKQFAAKNGPPPEATPEEEDANALPEILQINYDCSCYGKVCSNCSKYFGCTLSRKENASLNGTAKHIAEATKDVKHIVAVMSCKGGVGKSTFAANLAIALAREGRTTAIADCDFHGPCIPRILGVEGRTLRIGSKGIIPVAGDSGVRVLSMGLLLQPDENVTWFDWLKKRTVEEFLYFVNYGELDYLIIDLPPGTGAESSALLQSLPTIDGTIIVTIPALGPQSVVMRSINLCQQAGVKVIGVVENMSGFVCAACGSISRMADMKGGEDLARKYDIPFLGGIPLDHKIADCCDRGVPFVNGQDRSPATESFLTIVRKIRKTVETSSR